jgi:hypothetical protein
VLRGTLKTRSMTSLDSSSLSTRLSRRTPLLAGSVSFHPTLLGNMPDRLPDLAALVHSMIRSLILNIRQTV